MSAVDWLVLVGTLSFIVVYGMWRSRGVTDVDTYVRGGNTLRWPTIGLSIMATQASAIAFLSAPGQAYEDGMRFVQFYFGLPIAMVVISAVFVPIYMRLRVYTAYEYLEHRFDARVRYLGAILFLLGRGLAAGITIYAPSIILNSVLGWRLEPTIWAIGAAVVVYTVSGGTRAVSMTQKHQMIIMLVGLMVAAVIVMLRLPDGVSVPDAIRVAGALDRMNVVSFDLDFDNRYNFWSGIAGGFFLAMSYFGTDQSQVQRYLSGRSVGESRLGLLFNGMFKVPMQFVILFVGVMVFVFYLFTRPPIFFNAPALEAAAAGEHAPALRALEADYSAAFADQQAAARDYIAALDSPGEAAARDALRDAAAAADRTRDRARELIARAVPDTATRDGDYVFLSFVLSYIPRGLVGLLIAVILCAAMSSVASELAALGSTTAIDLYGRIRAPAGAGSSQPHGQSDLRITKVLTILWGAIIIGFASTFSLFDNLIEVVNIIGSVFYGTILGLFTVAMFLRWVSATPVFIAALCAEATVIALHFTSNLGFLWFNVIGCAIVVAVSLALEQIRRLIRE